jgi:hypothetical protein
MCIRRHLHWVVGSHARHGLLPAVMMRSAMRHSCREERGVVCSLILGSLVKKATVADSSASL